MRRKNLLVALLCAVFCMVSVSVMAFNQNPSLNWGYTDFLDGAAISQPPGFVFNPKVATYSTNTFKDGNGNTIPGRNKLNLVAFAPQLIYTAPIQLPWGLKFGGQVQWSIVSLNATSNIGLTADSGMIGDVVFGPFIGRAHNLGKDWNLHWFFEFDTYAPIGSYDKTAAFNAGANFWTFEPFVAATLTMPYGFELSTRQHYLWNTKNNDYVNPAATGDFQSHSLQAGDMWRFNYTLSKSLDFITPLLRLGVVGYYGQQTSSDQLDNNTVASSKEKIFAIGPGISYTYIREGERKPTAIFSLKAYSESNAEARAQGTRVVFRMIMPF